MASVEWKKTKKSSRTLEEESEAFIPRNGREWEFPLTPATSLVHNQFEDYLVSFLTQLCDRMTCQRIVDRIIICIFGK